MESELNMNLWRDCIRAWYPDYETRSYFVPPVVITRIPFDVVTVAGQSVSVPESNSPQDLRVRSNQPKAKGQIIQECDMREDTAVQRALLCWRELTKEQCEPMFVLSQLQFSDYLGEPSYAAAAKQFSRPQDLSSNYKRGDFDILVISRRFGIIIGEIKAVLSKQLTLSQDEIYKVVANRVTKAITQLNKSEVVLREITKDLEPNLASRKMLILPYVTADYLKRVVSLDEKLKQELVTCLQADDIEQALQYCLLADNFSSDGKDVVNVHRWWSAFVAASSESEMKAETYLDLLARFCGPATTVSVHCPMSPRIEVRTEGQGVAVTGERMMKLVLTPEQIRLLFNPPAKVMLTGPPGVGKSVMLVLMALTWLRQGHDVHLVSVWTASLAATYVMKNMLEETMRVQSVTPSEMGTVQLSEYEFYKNEADVDKAIDKLTSLEVSEGPYVICDEFFAPDSPFDRYKRFVTKLCTFFPKLCLWAATTFHHQKPEELREEKMTIPLRCPPAVVNEVEKAVSKYKFVREYTTTALATPCDGPNIIHLEHKGSGHAGNWPLECVQCGQSIADTLLKLGCEFARSVDSGNTCITTASTAINDSLTRTANINTPTACPPLLYRDILVLTRSTGLRDNINDETGCVTSQANGIVCGLRDAGIPVHVIREGHEPTDLRAMAERESNAVTVAFYGDVSGLERKVVVWLPDKNPGVNNDYNDELLYAADMTLAISRCTAQLVVIDVPELAAIYK